MISLPQIASTSPSLAETMRSCMLRAGLTRCAQLQPFILGNPKAWLGTAYHKVMEQIPVIVGASGDPLAEADAVWNTEIARLEQVAAGHPLNSRFGPATLWKGYFLVQATMRLRVEQAAVASATTPPPAGAPSFTVREAAFTDALGKLRGKIDLVRGDDLIDFKTGSIFEGDEPDGPAIVKLTYVRQLRIYAWLVHASTGRWVKRGLLHPLAGPPIEVALDPIECECEAAAAIELLDSYNVAVAAGNSLVAMATPSPEACRWCPYKALCPAFWTAVNPDWSGGLDGEVIRGEVASAPQPVFAADAFSLIVNVEGGTQASGSSVRLSPLPALIHHGLTSLVLGQRIVMIRLGLKANGAPYPLLQTLLLTDDQLSSTSSNSSQ